MGYRCRCECGNVFDSGELVEYKGYNGDSWQEWLSPCCALDYEEIGD